MDVPRLHPDTIEEVKQRTDIYDVVSEHVVLKKQGKDFAGLCPFHDEKTPSFTVSPSKQMYYCFGCQAGGNAITFLMELGKRSFADVVLDLARRYQVPIKTLEPEQREALQRQLSRREQLYEILAIAASFYQHALHQSQGESALNYLRSQRQLSDATIDRFGLGYAPAGWESLYGYLVEQKRYSIKLVEEAGLILPRKSGGGYYDRFRDRLMIPIHDIQGRVIGFGGRTLGDEQPKYLNSPETELFDKGKTLFALDKAKGAISKEDKAVVVEGYFDAIALHSAGIENAVASLGTALSVDQVRLLLRYTDSKQVVFNFDADAAGIKAAERAIGEIGDLAYRGQVQLRILSIPDGKDADEFLKSSGSCEPYRQLLDNAPLWLEWQIEQLVSTHDLSRSDQFQKVAGRTVELLAKISDGNTRTHYISYCAELFSQGDGRLISMMAQNLRAQVRKLWRKKCKDERQNDLPPLLSEPDSSEPVEGSESASFMLPTPGDRQLLEEAELVLLRIYLHCPQHRREIVNFLEEKDLGFSLSHHRFLWQQILEIERSLEGRSSPSANPFSEGENNSLISDLQDRIQQHKNQVGGVSHLFYLDEKTQRDILNTRLMVQAAIACIERVMCEKRYRYLLKLWQETDYNRYPDRCLEYQQQIYQEKTRIQELDSQRHVSLNDLLQI
ncbi:MAG: DNA primase [Cyanobacteria bacterium J007]|nr:MAG: DNA primase [Cyanobacteria bacterium J007]